MAKCDLAKTQEDRTSFHMNSVFFFLRGVSTFVHVLGLFVWLVSWLAGWLVGWLVGCIFFPWFFPRSFFPCLFHVFPSEQWKKEGQYFVSRKQDVGLILKSFLRKKDCDVSFLYHNFRPFSLAAFWSLLKTLSKTTKRKGQTDRPFFFLPKTCSFEVNRPLVLKPSPPLGTEGHWRLHYAGENPGSAKTGT